MKKYEGEFVLDGVTHKCAVIDGERFVDGKPIDEFMDTLNESQLRRSALVGAVAIKDEVEGFSVRKGRYQYLIHDPKTANKIIQGEL